MASATLGETYTRKMTLAATYESSNGKFPSAYGNVAILDCHYIFNYFFDYAGAIYAPTLPIAERATFLLAIRRLEKDLLAEGVTWCNFGYEIDGVLTDQSSYYLGQFTEIEQKVQAKQLEIAN
jgi:hypothetical protein